MTWIDIMGVDATRQSRWDKHDGETSIAALDGALVAAGLPDRLAAPRRLLAQAEALAGQARTSKDAARNRLEQANRALFADGPVDVGGYGATLVECGPWLSEEAPGMVGVMQAVAQIRGNATQVAFAMATGLHAELQEVCRGVVAEAAEVPVLPRSCGRRLRPGRRRSWRSGRVVRLIGRRWCGPVSGGMRCMTRPSCCGKPARSGLN